MASEAATDRVEAQPIRPDAERRQFGVIIYAP
jgi:hypothetical protein